MFEGARRRATARAVKGAPKPPPPSQTEGAGREGALATIRLRGVSFEAQLHEKEYKVRDAGGKYGARPA